MENYVNVKGIKIWTEVKGQGKLNILLASGGPGSASDYLDAVSKMLEPFARVIKFDPRACGRSSEDYSCDLETTISDVEAIRKFYNIDSWVVLGHSWGANLLLAYTILYPQYVSALIYMSGIGIQRNREWTEAYRKNKSLFGEIQGFSNYEGNSKVNKLGNQSWQNYIRRPNMLSDLTKINTPSLFIHGSKDIRPAWPAQQLANIIKNSEYKVIENAAHYIWLSHEKALENVLQTFLKTYV